MNIAILDYTRTEEQVIICECPFEQSEDVEKWLCEKGWNLDEICWLGSSNKITIEYKND